MSAPYATIVEMETRWGEVHLETMVGAIASHVNAALSDLLDNTSNQIETYLRAAGYAVPLTTTPGVIKTACLEMTYVKCFSAQYSDVKTPPAEVKSLYWDYWVGEDGTGGWFKMLRDGQVKLDVSTEPTEDTIPAQTISQTLTRDDMSMTNGKGDSNYNSLGNFAINDTESSDES